MANVDRPNGLRPVGSRTGAPWSGQTNMYLLDSGDGTATFVGDLVKLAGAAGIAGQTVNGVDVEGMPTVAQSTAGGVHVGVIVGFLPNQDNLSQKHRAASTSRIALVADDPNTVFEVQEVSGGTALTSAEVGLNANVVVGAGNTTTGASGMELNNGSEAVTATLDLRILGLAKRPDNAFGEHAKWLVLINAHQYGNVGTTGI